MEKVKADEALSEAYPAVEAAAAALDNLDKDDLNELKQFNNPATAIVDVCVGVVYLNPHKASGGTDDSWAGCKKMLQTPNFLKVLKEFNKDGIASKQIKNVKKMLKKLCLS